MKKPIEISPGCRAHLAASSIAICGLARNCATKLSANIKFIEELRSYFNFSQVIVVENNSQDDTRTILSHWSASSPNVVILDGVSKSTITKEVQGDKKVNPYYSYNRISYLAALRNQYLTYIKSQERKFDYVLVLDFDVDQISLTGVLNSFEQREYWNVICAYGRSISPRLRERMHDTYALVLLGEENKPQQEKPIKQIQRDLRFDKIAGPLFPVYSAFGGLSIYKGGALEGVHYQAIKNNDAKVEVRCEHFSICHQIQQKGLTKIMINPQMHLRYEKFWETIKRNIVRSNP